MRRIGSRAGLNFLYELLAKEQKFYINYILSTCDAIIDNSDKDNKSEICGRLGKLLFERQEWTLAKNYFSKAKEIKSNPETESYIAILDSISDEPRIMTNLSQNNVIDYNKSWYSAELIYRFFSNDTLNEEQLREREEKMVKCARGIRSIFNTEKGLDDSGKKKTSTIIGSLQLDFIRMNSQAVPESYIVVNAVQKKSIEITLNITNTEDDTIFITPYLFKLITKDSVRIAPLLTVQPEDYLYNINRLKILSIPPKSKSNYWLNFIIAKEAVPSALEVEYTDAINRFTVFLSLTR
jgi:hypothetical protein